MLLNMRSNKTKGDLFMKNLLGKFNIEKIKHLSCEKRPGNLGGSRSRLIRQSLADANSKTKLGIFIQNNSGWHSCSGIYAKKLEKNFAPARNVEFADERTFERSSPHS